MRDDLTILIPVRDGMPRLRECIESIQCTKHLLVVLDDRSEDDSEAYLTSNNVPYYRQAWLGFGPQQQTAVERAKTDWVMKLDADELLTEDLNQEILSMDLGDPRQIFSFPRKNHISGVWIRHGGWWPDRVRRLFNRNEHHFDDAEVHENIVGERSVEVDCQEALNHHPYDSMEDFHRKIDQYAKLGAEKLRRQGRHVSPFSPFTHAASSFLATYIIRKAFLDGYWGAVVAWSASTVTFKKYRLARSLPPFD